MVPPGGYKGGTIRAGASCSPLKPASLLTFLPEQESKAPAGSARSQFRTEIFCESLLPLQCPVSFLRCMVGYRQPPASTNPKTNRNCTARWLPQSRLRRASSLPEGAMGLYLFTWVCAYGKVPTVNPSVTAKATGGSPAVPAPFDKGAF